MMRTKTPEKEYPTCYLQPIYRCKNCGVPEPPFWHCRSKHSR